MNRYTRPFGTVTDTTKPVVVENCVLVGNYYAYYNAQYDLCDHAWSPSCTAGAILFKNCVYGKANSEPFKTQMSSCTYPGSVVYQLGVGGFPSDAGLKSGSDAAPYSLKGSSPLRGRGCVADWMYQSTDILGNPRLSNSGTVDIGCYQFQQAGFKLLAQ